MATPRPKDFFVTAVFLHRYEENQSSGIVSGTAKKSDSALANHFQTGLRQTLNI